MSRNHNTSSSSANVRKDGTKESEAISGFQGYFSFLSNDHPAWVNLDGLNFPSVSTAFQAARTDDQKLRQKIANVTDIDQFRKLALSIPNPPDWPQRKQKIMSNLIRDKFKRNKQILDKLLGTKEKKLVNVMKNGGYNEEFWGVFEGKGKNILGKILMGIREEFVKGLDTKMWIENNLNLEPDLRMCAVVSLMVMKDGKKMERLNLDKNKNYYLFGSLKTVDFNLQNPTISRNHACLYFSQLEVMIVDLKSTHGTFIKRKGEPQKQQLQPLVGYRLYKDDTLLFGTSAREYIIEIDRSQIEKYIAQQEQSLKEPVKEIPQKYQNAEQYSKLSKEQLKGVLGIENSCLLVQDLKEGDGYPKLKEYFGKFDKIKSVRFRVNSKTGRNQGSAIIYFEGQNTVTNMLKNKKEIAYKIRGIGKAEADAILGKKDHEEKRRRSRSRSNSKEKGRRERNGSRSRSRSRDKNKKNRH